MGQYRDECFTTDEIEEFLQKYIKDAVDTGNDHDLQILYHGDDDNPKDFMQYDIVITTEDSSDDPDEVYLGTKIVAGNKTIYDTTSQGEMELYRERNDHTAYELSEAINFDFNTMSGNYK